MTLCLAAGELGEGCEPAAGQTIHTLHNNIGTKIKRTAQLKFL